MQNYTRDVEITLMCNKSRAKIWMFPYFVANNNVNLIVYEKEPNLCRKVLSYTLDYYSEFYENIKDKKYYIISCVDEEINEVSLLNNFSGIGVFIKAVDIFKNIKITPYIKQLKNNHLKQLAKAKLFLYYDSLMKGKSEAHPQRGIKKSYEIEVVNFISCLKYAKYQIPLEILFIIMKFIKFS